jgi:hypothetical protein
MENQAYSWLSSHSAVIHVKHLRRGIRAENGDGRNALNDLLAPDYRYSISSVMKFVAGSARR